MLISFISITSSIFGVSVPVIFVISGIGDTLRANSPSTVISMVKNELLMFHSRVNFFDSVGYIGNIGGAITNIVGETLLKKNVISLMKHAGVDKKILKNSGDML